MNSVPIAQCSLPSRQTGSAWSRWSTRSCSWHPCESRTRLLSDSAKYCHWKSSHLITLQILYNGNIELISSVTSSKNTLHILRLYLPLCPSRCDHWPRVQRRRWCLGKCWGRHLSGSSYSLGTPWTPSHACLRHCHKHLANAWDSQSLWEPPI